MKKIGDIRTFEKIEGKWKIKEIYNKSIMFTLKLKSLKCKYCGKDVYNHRNYTFNHIEKLENGINIKYLGISTCNKYVLLDDYRDKSEIEKKIKEVK